MYVLRSSCIKAFLFRLFLSRSYVNPDGFKQVGVYLLETQSQTFAKTLTGHRKFDLSTSLQGIITRKKFAFASFTYDWFNRYLFVRIYLKLRD